MSKLLKVLILEDNQSDVELMLHELKRAGYDTEWICVERQTDFLDQLNTDWDVILSDYTLPQYNGLQALMDMQELGKDFPFIIVTGSISEEVAVECMKNGATDYLIKDRLARLGSAISRAIEEKISCLEREHTERLIFENELRYRAIFENAAVSILEEDFSAVKKTIDDLKEHGVTDFSAYCREQPQFLHQIAESIIILDVNHETLRMFGAGSKDELLGSLDKVMLPEAIDILREEVVAIAEGKTYFKGETISQTLQGERINTLISLSIPQETGEFNRVLVSMMDITDRKRAEQQIEHSRNFLELVLNTTPSAVFTVDLERNITSWNKMAAEITGYSAEEVIGQHCDMFESPTCKVCLLFDDNVEKPALYAECSLTSKGGEKVLVLKNVDLLANSLGEIIGGIESFVDITERNKFERQSQRLLEQQVAANQLALALGESLLLEDIYRIIYDHIKGLMDAFTFIISFFDPETNLIRAVYVINEEQLIDAANLPHLPLAESGKGIQSQVIRTGEVHYTADYLRSLKNSKSKYVIEKDGVIQDATVTLQGGNTRSAVYVPMKDKGNVIGVMQVQSEHHDAYAQEDIDLLSGLANVASIAIQNARLFDNARQRLNELEMVNRISVALRAAETLHEILPIFLDETLSLLDTSSGSIVIYDENSAQFETQICRGWFEVLHFMPPNLEAGISGRVFKTGETYTSAEFSSEPLVLPEIQKMIPENWGGACFPVHVGPFVTGLIYVSVAHPRQINSEEIILIETLAEMIGVAIHRTRLRQKAQKQIQRLAALRTLDSAINASLDMKIVTDVLLEQTKTLLDVDLVRLLILDPHSHYLEYAGSIGFRGDIQKQLRLRLGESQAGQTALRREINLIPDLALSGETFDKPEFLEGEGIVAYFAMPLIAKGQLNGVLEAMHRMPMYPDQDWVDFFKTLAGLAALAIDNTTMFRELQKSNLDLALAYDSTLEGWARALEYRDMETEGHSRRVVDLTVKIVSEYGISDREKLHIRRGALLHDIGKMGVPDSILQKAGPLDEEEWEIMRQHPLYAFEMLSHIAHLRPALDIPRYHHEKWDGSGYPRGLKGEQIPIAARIFAIVDVWDALLSDRPYRQAWPEVKVIDYLKAQSGKHFDPEVVEVFLRVLEREKNKFLSSAAKPLARDSSVAKTAPSE